VIVKEGRMLMDWNVSSGNVWSNRLRIKMLTSPRGKRGNRGSWVRLVLQCMVTAPGFGNGDVVITIVAEALGAVVLLATKNSLSGPNYLSWAAARPNVLSVFPGFLHFEPVPVQKR
jgi:hypothetical protein